VQTCPRGGSLESCRPRKASFPVDYFKEVKDWGISGTQRAIPATAMRSRPVVEVGLRFSISGSSFESGQGLLRLHSRWDRSAAHRRPLSRGSNPCGYPHKLLVSYRINRQLSGWIPPPLMICAFGAHCHLRTRAVQQKSHHSIISSARARRVDGTSRPIAFAVVRLMTRSNFIGCSTGISPGFVPRRILST
jgi:hypothetical protein